MEHNCYYRYADVKSMDANGNKTETWECFECGKCILLNRTVENWVARSGGKWRCKK